MDPIALAGMLLSLLLTVVIVGGILVFPIMRRLGAVLEVWLNEKRQGALQSTDARALRDSIATLAERMERLEDRQLFLEELVERGSLGGSSPPGTLPPETRPRDDEA
ncbi:MAG: hypothetical protein P8Z36_09050 [Gemmatimonadota bacterium]|jgi:hypothetical protein